MCFVNVVPNEHNSFVSYTTSQFFANKCSIWFERTIKIYIYCSKSGLEVSINFPMLLVSLAGFVDSISAYPSIWGLLLSFSLASFSRHPYEVLTKKIIWSERTKIMFFVCVAYSRLGGHFICNITPMLTSGLQTKNVSSFFI